MTRAARTILIGQLSFYIGLLIAILVRPSGLAANSGISYYGIYGETFLPYAIGLLGAAYCMIMVARGLNSAERTIKRLLIVYALLVVGIVVTPYSVSAWIDHLHVVFGTLLFSGQIILSYWFTRRLKYVWWAITLTLAEIISGLICEVYLTPSHGFLLQAQVAFQTAFSCLTALALPQLRMEKRLTAPSEDES